MNGNSSGAGGVFGGKFQLVGSRNDTNNHDNDNDSDSQEYEVEEDEDVGEDEEEEEDEELDDENIKNRRLLGCNDKQSRKRSPDFDREEEEDVEYTKNRSGSKE